MKLRWVIRNGEKVLQTNGDVDLENWVDVPTEEEKEECEHPTPQEFGQDPSWGDWPYCPMCGIKKLPE